MNQHDSTFTMRDDARGPFDERSSSLYTMKLDGINDGGTDTSHAG